MNLKEYHSLVDDLINSLDELIKKDTENKRTKIAELIHKLFIDNFKLSHEYSADIACTISDLGIMNGDFIKEPHILHMPIEDVKNYLTHLKKCQQTIKK